MLGDAPSAPLTAPAQPGLPSKRFSADKSELLAGEYRQQRLQEYKKNESQAGLQGSRWTGLKTGVEGLWLWSPLLPLTASCLFRQVSVFL